MIKNSRLIWGAVSFGAVLLFAGCGSDTENSASSTSTTTTVAATTTASSASSTPAESVATQPYAADSGNSAPTFIPGSSGGETGQIPGSATPGDPTSGSIPGPAGDGGSGLVPGEPSAAGTYCGPGYNELAVWAFGAGCDTAIVVQANYGAQLSNSGSKSTTVEVGGSTWLCDEYTGDINPYLQCSSDDGAVRLTS